MEDTKVCPKCGEEKPLTRDYWNQHKWCKTCCRKAYKQRYEANGDHIRTVAKAWKKENRKTRKRTKIERERERRQQTKRYYNRTDEQKEHDREVDKIFMQKARALCADQYIKGLLSKMGYPITPEIMELKREQIMIHRKIRHLREVLNGFNTQ